MWTQVLEKSGSSQGARHRSGSYIAGDWVQTKDQREVIDPATAEPFAKVGRIQQQQVSTAW